MKIASILKKKPVRKKKAAPKKKPVAKKKVVRKKAAKKKVGAFNKMAMNYRLTNNDQRNVEQMWYKLSADKTKSRGEIIDEISKKLKINWFEISSYLKRNIPASQVGATNRQKKVLKNKYLISRALEKQDYSTAKKKRISTRRTELTKKTQKVFDKVKKSEVEALKSTLFYISKTENEINNYVNFLLTDGKGLSNSEKNGYRKMIKQKKQLLSEYKTHAKELKKLI